MPVKKCKVEQIVSLLRQIEKRPAPDTRSIS